MTRERSGRPGRPRRRDLLRAAAGAGAAALAGCSALGGGGDGGDATATPTGENRARELAERFAPRLYYDSAELWFPTDPRPYTAERDSETVVDGFEALNGYTRRRNEERGLPDPTVFFRALEYDDAPLAVVQFWLYGAFDQFTTNFHWHDWELLQVFLDTDTDEPVLYDASSHSRSVPNNEFLDPGERRPRLLSELGSHSSALSVNDRPEQFDRYLDGGTIADVTNSALEAGGALEGLPVAYGLPRDEGFRLPFVVPELDGAPLYDHERLPDVERSDLVPPELTVRSFDALDALPTDLPARETGLVLDHEDGAADADATYGLVRMAELEDIDAFTGPQLSFEFAVPGFLEDAAASHITSVDPPWSQPRYTDPVADVTDPTHRAALAERYDAVDPGGPLATIAAGVSEAVASPDAPDGEGLTTQETGVEAVALLQSDPVAVPTFRGAAVLRDVPPGDHRLTVNAAGAAPHSETVAASDGATVAGVGGEIPLVARRNAVRLGVDADGAAATLERLAVEDDFAGRLYDAPLEGPDAVYVHRDGAFTAEVEDTDGELGAYRVTPADEAELTVDRPETGTASLASFLAEISAETAASVRAVADDGDDETDGEGNGTGGGTGPPAGDPGPVRGLARALEAVASNAGRAAEAARSGDGAAADRRLAAVTTGLETVAERLAEAREGLPGPRGRATERRLEQARTRAEQALAAGKL